MTYLRDSVEYLEADEHAVYVAVKLLNSQGHSTNNSQVAAATGLSRPRCAMLADGLKRRGYLRDAAPDSAAYHWRVTDKEVQTQ